MSNKLIPLNVRFWKYVEKSDDCWNWTGAHLAKGYGVIGIGPGMGNILAHRASWEIHFGKIPNGLWVLHHCDNPCCVNPNHLFLGTHRDNDLDRDSKCRQAKGESCAPKSGRLRGNKHWSHINPEKVRRGEKHHNAKLTENQVKLIREKRRDGISTTILANEFGMSTRTIRKIIEGTLWSHL